MKKIIGMWMLAGAVLWASPAWYHQLMNDKGSNYYIGYGQGKSEEEAKKRALDDIASQISVVIDNSLLMQTKLTDDQVHTDVLKRSKQDSYARLYGYEILKSSEMKGLFYVALGYENIPSIEKFKTALSKYAPFKKERQNNYLKATPVAKAVGYPIDFTLLRKDKIWYIKYHDLLQALEPRDFDLFFSSTISDNLSIQTNLKRHVLYEGDSFYFKIYSKKPGYVTVFDVYEDGTVSILMSNIKCDQGQTIRIPDIQSEQEFQAGLIEEGVETYDLYIVVLSDKKELYDEFSLADESLISQERYKNFDRLIQLLDTHPFSTLKLITKPKKNARIIK